VVRLLTAAIACPHRAFVGAPVLAREMENGTFRYAWTQGFGRCRWALFKLGTLAVALAAASGALSLLLSWYYQPYLVAGNQAAGLSELSPLWPGLFDLRGVGLAAWTLVAFATGALAGMLARRIVPAIVATLATYAGLAYAAALYLRQHYWRRWSPPTRYVGVARLRLGDQPAVDH